MHSTSGCGRVSRGAHPGYCCVFAEPTSPESEKRLEAFVRSTDGFELAEIDFSLRGPGDLLGTKQHGLPPLRVADPRTDAAVLEEARRDAQQLVADDPGLSKPEHERLRRHGTSALRAGAGFGKYWLSDIVPRTRAAVRPCRVVKSCPRIPIRDRVSRQTTADKAGLGGR